MSAETSIYSTLIAASGVTALVVARIYPDFISQEISLPAIVTQRTGTEYTNTIHSGAAEAKLVTMDAWCLSASRIGAEVLADAVASALPSGLFRLVDRRTEFDPETVTYSSVVTSEIWE